MQEVYYTQEK